MRRKNDFYPTQVKLTEGLIGNISSYINTFEDYILEPCNGEGHISNVLKSRFNLVFTSDKVKEKGEFHLDAVDESSWKIFEEKIGRIDWTITNVPFTYALPIIQNALKFSKVGVAILVRLSFLEPTYDRQSFLDENPPDIIIVNPRTSFTEDGKTDSVTTCWLIWGKNNLFGKSSYKHFRVIKK